MTLIEIFDRSPIENLVSTLALRPDQTIYIGTDVKRMQRALPVYREILDGRGIGTELIFRSAAKNDLEATLAVIDMILDERSDEPDEICLVDISGGDETLLLSVGLILGTRAWERRKLLAFRLNLFTRIATYFLVRRDENGELAVAREQQDFSNASGNPLYLTVDENVMLHGGSITSRSETFDLDDPVCEDIDALWEVSRKDCVGWNASVGRLSAEVSRYADGNNLYAIPEEALGTGKNKLNRDFFNQLVGRGLIKLRRNESGLLIFNYKNRIVRECLTKSGSVLEYYTYKTALKMRENGFPVFDSVETGVVLDWDGRANGTRNEIDVMMMRGVTPVFISCKNGDISVDELYKIGAVADRFGADFSRRALLSTAFFDSGSRGFAGPNASNNMEERARDMRIRPISCVHRMTESEFAQALSKLAL